MISSQIYIAISIAVLAIIALVRFFVGGKRKNKTEKMLTPLTSIAFGFIIAGIAFGDSRLIGYSLMGIGVLLAVIDIFKKLNKR
ncbi:hypothetical protein KY347_06225 [Candidatus Woesearchaeota archaeon]|nr:hypothetical protein [Candidatus Woesearchaeota archaeon]